MALIAVHTVVDVPAALRVTEIGRVPAPMTLRALENRIVRGICMARSTHAVCRVSAVSHGEKGMVEYCAGPGCRRVAGGTSCREPGCRVSRIRRGVVSCRVATVARDWQRRIVVVHVTARTGNRRGVIARQWESGRVVIENRAGPDCRGVASLASLGEPDLHVVRSGRGRVFIQVARNAGCHGDAVVVVDVAASASNRSVKTG
jgi:hypothetical protein